MKAAAAGVAACVAGKGSAAQGPPKVAPLTRGPKHHFFGYYGICPWDGDEKRLLCLESAFQDRMPEPGEAATVGLVDAESGAFVPIAETRAWNFQQGAMLHWHPLRPNTEVLFNDVQDGELVSQVHNLETGEKRVLPRPASGLGKASPWAVSLTYGRLGRLRKVVGYADAVDPYADDPHPEADGVFAVNIDTGETRLIVSIAQVYELIKARGLDLGDKHLWFNHTVINRNDTRLLFLARTRSSVGSLQTGMYTVGMDGADLREVIPYDRSVSHFDWRNNREIVATCWPPDRTERSHVLLTDGEDDLRVLGGGKLDFDGHCTFSPDGQWIAMDRKDSRKLESELLIYHLDRDEVVSVGTFHMHERRFIKGDLRCDLHPRWSRTGDALCFDCLEPEKGTRQLHVASGMGTVGSVKKSRRDG
jgi:hypothetical protein